MKKSFQNAYLKASPERRCFLLCKRDIAYKLYNLRMAKRYPDNYDKGFVQRSREGLSIAMTWYYKMLRDHPEFKETEQLNLFKILQFKETK